MCQSKAEGGRRCAFHLEQGVASGMCTYAASLTGLTPKETAAAYETLQSEGHPIADPTRAEVDEFLEKQIFRVRHEPDLSEKRRESIVARLRAAIGRITPDGATFHAWKNIVSESWARVRRRAAAAFVVGALTFSVGACGNVPQESHEPAQAEQVAAATTEAGFDTTFNDVKPTISQTAIDKYGAKAAAAGGDAAVTVTETYAYNQEAYVAVRPAGQDQVLAAAELMTPSTARDWKHTVDTYVNGPNKKAIDAAFNNVTSLTFYDPINGATHQGKPLMVQTEGPGVVNQKIKSATVSLDNTGRLMVEVDSSALLRVKSDGKSFVIKTDREITYYMVRSADDVWKIDGWEGSFVCGAVRPEK